MPEAERPFPAPPLRGRLQPSASEPTRGQAHGVQRQRALLLAPQLGVAVRGELTVTDPAAFARTLSTGLGRAKSYGCGLLLVKPAR
ncbi:MULTISPECIES: type I-E CRISPR-associated protein Cas6/Cse3/CasE [Streptomyces]|uniref:type I-E CRISPR-associated protein Cas6/Cse3/CasE n=1 Tax=Streptomyces TaxID=1883 RepID=UPI001D04A1D2|nr:MULTISPECIES: type I-E CRISPR-associated protein Cas6/Cse3/CasE [Streptomyces]